MSSRRRVLHVTPSFAPAYRIGGPVRSLEGLLGELSRIGVEVRVLTTDSNGDTRLDMPRGWTAWKGVPVRYMPRVLPPSLAPGLGVVAYREARRADVVHVTGLFSVASMQGLVAGISAGRPVVLSPRGVLQAEALKFGRSAQKMALLRALSPLLARVSLFHATSDEEAHSVQHVLGPSAPVVVIPNGTPIAPVSIVQARRARQPERPRIGFVGRLHPIKALERLIDACALLRDRGNDFELCIAGPAPDPRYRQSLVERVEHVGLAERTSFEGEVLGERKDDFYASLRVFVLPSRSENFGNVVVEALAFRTPVVASRGTPWRHLEAVGAGRWVENDPESLANAIEPYLQRRELAENAGANGRRLVEERYTWPAAAMAMSDAYEQACRVHKRVAQARAHG